MGQSNQVIVKTASITGVELKASGSKHWCNVSATELLIKSGFKTIVGYSLPSSGGASTIKAHIVGDETGTLRDIELADSGAFNMMPAIDYIDIALSGTIDDSLILLAE